MTGNTDYHTESKRAEEAKSKAKEELEIKVEECTAELMAANRKLRQEIEVRNKAQKAFQEGPHRKATFHNVCCDPGSAGGHR